MLLKHRIYGKNKRQGRNNTGKITVRHRGGGVKRLIRILKSSRHLKDVIGIVKYNEYDPNRNTNLSVIFYENGIKHYIIKPKGLNIGDKIIFSNNVEKNPGNSTFLSNINIGVKIKLNFNIVLIFKPHFFKLSYSLNIIINSQYIL